MQEKLKALREYLGLSLNAFGTKIGYTGKQIGRYEKGITPVSERVIKKIVDAYYVNPGYFKGGVPLEEAVEKIDWEKEKAEIATRIKERRTELGLSQRELSIRCGYNEHHISKIELQKVILTNEAAKKIAGVLEVGVDWLLKGDETKKKYPLDEKLQEWLWKHEEVRKELWKKMEEE